MQFQSSFEVKSYGNEVSNAIYDIINRSGRLSNFLVNIQNPPLEEFQEDTSIIDLTEATEVGSQVLRVEFVNSTGDDIIGSLAEGLNRAQREGRS